MHWTARAKRFSNYPDWKEGLGKAIEKLNPTAQEELKVSEVKYGVFVIIILAAALAALPLVDEVRVVWATVVALVVLTAIYCFRRSTVS